MNKILYEADSFFLLLNCPEEPNYPLERYMFNGVFSSDLKERDDERYQVALKSCERIKIDNPEILFAFVALLDTISVKPGDLFPIPEGIEWDILESLPPKALLKLKSEPVEVKGESQDSRITVAANVIRFLSEYIHGLNSGRNTEAVDLALLNASDQLRILTRKAIDK